MINKAIILGRLGNDPEVRFAQEGGQIVNFSVATDRAWKNRDGELVKHTEWHRVVFFGKQAEVCSKYLNKGSLVYVEGRIETKKFTDKAGVEKYSTQIVGENMKMLGGGKGSDSGESAQSGSGESDVPPSVSGDGPVPF